MIPGVVCHAEDKIIGSDTSVGVDIWVSIANGGTAVISTQGSNPMPDNSKIVLADSRLDAFHIDYSEEGLYNYEVKIEPDDRDIEFDTTVYDVKVYITDNEGKLIANVVIYDKKTGEKYAPSQTVDGMECVVSFNNYGGSSGVPVEPTEPTNPSDPETPTQSPPETTTQAPPETTTQAPPETTTEETSETSTEQSKKTTSKKKKKSGSGSSSSGSSTGSDSSSGHQPKTGDDTRLDWYLFIAMLASFGLFMISIFFYLSVNKEIKLKGRR